MRFNNMYNYLAIWEPYPSHYYVECGSPLCKRSMICLPLTSPSLMLLIIYTAHCTWIFSWQTGLLFNLGIFVALWFIQLMVRDTSEEVWMAVMFGTLVPSRLDAADLAEESWSLLPPSLPRNFSGQISGRLQGQVWEFPGPSYRAHGVSLPCVSLGSVPLLRLPYRGPRLFLSLALHCFCLLFSSQGRRCSLGGLTQPLLFLYITSQELFSAHIILWYIWWKNVKDKVVLKN